MFQIGAVTLAVLAGVGAPAGLSDFGLDDRRDNRTFELSALLEDECLGEGLDGFRSETTG